MQQQAVLQCAELHKLEHPIPNKSCCKFFYSFNSIEFQEKIYTQETGVVTGENNSVAIANISLHYVINMIPEIRSNTIMFKRYIDDVIYLTRDQQKGVFIKEKLIATFKEHELQLTFR